MSEGMNERDVKLEAYLDGTLGEAERAAFEGAMAADADLRREVEAQRLMDAAIRRMFVPAPGREAAVAAEAPVAGTIGPAGDSGKRRRNQSRQVRRALLAAALLLVAAGVYYFGPMGPESDLLFGGARVSAAEYYRSVVDAGFRPLTVCEDDAQFKAWTRERLGAAMLMNANPAISLVGWTYGVTPMSDDTSVLLARVNGREVVVLMDKSASRLHRVKTGGADGGAGLSVFKRTVGPVVMYEITPEGKPWVTDRFYQDCGTGG